MTISFGIAIGAIIATIINVAANHLANIKKESIEKENNVNVLFGELLNILNHYQFSCIPINLIDGLDKDINEVIKRMEFAKYGEFEASKNVKLYGFLSAIQVRNIHQLALKIRNTDTMIDKYLLSEYVDKKEMATQEEIHLAREIDSRMHYVSNTAELLLHYISEQHPEYSSLINETKTLQKPNYEI